LRHHHSQKHDTGGFPYLLRICLYDHANIRRRGKL
jgi:hypothetical protein